MFLAISYIKNISINSDLCCVLGKTVKMNNNTSVCVCFTMPTHCTIMRFGFHARWIDGVKCGLFLNHALLGQTTIHVG